MSSFLKSLSQSEARVAILDLCSTRKTNLVEDVKILLPVSFVAFCSAVSKKNSKLSKPIRGQDGHLGFQIGPKNHKIGRGH